MQEVTLLPDGWLSHAWGETGGGGGGEGERGADAEGDNSRGPRDHNNRCQGCDPKSVSSCVSMEKKKKLAVEAAFTRRLT